MLIKELFESDYTESIQNILLDYLAALASKGNKKISVKQVIHFLKNNKKIHITTDMIENLLDDTGFELVNNIIRIRPEEEDEPENKKEKENELGKPDPNDVVGNMAQDRLAKEIQ